MQWVEDNMKQGRIEDTASEEMKKTGKQMFYSRFEEKSLSYQSRGDLGSDDDGDPALTSRPALLLPLVVVALVAVSSSVSSSLCLSCDRLFQFHSRNIHTHAVFFSGFYSHHSTSQLLAASPPPAQQQQPERLFFPRTTLSHS